jgi:hypothetical protein
MTENKAPNNEPQPAEDDTEGHSLLLDTDYYIQRKPRDAGPDREHGNRRQLKDTRPNKPERRH